MSPGERHHPSGRRDRNWVGWLIAGLSVAALILLLVLWSMRPSRQGQPGQPGQHGHHDHPAASAPLVPGFVVSVVPAKVPS